MNKEELVRSVLEKNAYIEQPLVGGMMNQSYIVNNEGKRYVLYISTEQANEMVDRPLERENQRLIIDLGLTSKNVYFDTEHGIKINEFIEGSSIDKINDYDISKVAALLKKMHTSGKLSRENYNPFSRFIAYEQEALTFDHKMEDEYYIFRDKLFENKDFLESQSLVLCHNDAQKSNIVKDIDGNYFLIDFEFMGNNDPIYDIATFGNGLVSEGFECLKYYFDGHPSKEEQDRYYLWRIFVSLQWHNVAIVKHYRGEGKTHGFDFLAVATFFLNNARDAYNGLMEK